MKGKRVRLGEVCFEYVERNRNSGCDSVCSVTNSAGFVASEEYFDKKVFSKDLAAYKVVRPGMFAYNPSRINVGSVACYEGPSPVVVSPLYIVFRVDEALAETRYLSHYIRSPLALHTIRSRTTGSVRDSLKFSALCQLEIPLPPLSAQRKIAEELDRICALKRAAEKVVEKLGVLAKAKFVEMFGDVKSNSKKFPCELGRDLFCFASGKFLPPESRLESGIPVYGGNGIAWYTSHALISGRTIAIGRVGAYCGNPHKIDMPSWITDNAIYIKKFKTNNFVLEYLYVLMREYDFSRFASKSGQPKITQRPLEEAEYILPPLPLQRQFAAYVGKVEKIEAAAKKVVEKLDVLYRAKLQEYFA